MNKESTQETVASARKYETPRLVDYGRLHSQTTGGSHTSHELNPGKGSGDLRRP